MSSKPARRKTSDAEPPKKRRRVNDDDDEPEKVKKASTKKASTKNATAKKSSTKKSSTKTTETTKAKAPSKKSSKKASKKASTKQEKKSKPQSEAEEGDDDEKMTEDDAAETETEAETEDRAGAAGAGSGAGAGSSVAGGSILDGLTDAGWKKALSGEFKKPYFDKILKFVAAERKKVTLFPPDHQVLSAFNETPFDKIKVVIIGQDPYFNPDQGHGLCFSVRKGVAVPPSLNRIYMELMTDCPGFKKPKHGYLIEWAQRGVLLLNATLTVQSGKANSHAKCGWQTFTDAVIQLINKELSGVVFILWGLFAQKKGKGIDRTKHHVIECAHPSPMSGGSWAGNKSFSKANAYLVSIGKKPIDWSISP